MHPRQASGTHVSSGRAFVGKCVKERKSALAGEMGRYKAMQARLLVRKSVWLGKLRRRRVEHLPDRVSK